MPLSLIMLSRITILSHDRITVTRFNYAHELINKLGQVNLTQRSLNIHCKIDQIGVCLVINPFNSLA